MTFGLVEELNGFSCSRNSSQQVIDVTVAKLWKESVKQLLVIGWDPQRKVLNISLGFQFSSAIEFLMETQGKVKAEVKTPCVLDGQDTWKILAYNYRSKVRGWPAYIISKTIIFMEWKNFTEVRLVGFPATDIFIFTSKDSMLLPYH